MKRVTALLLVLPLPAFVAFFAVFAAQAEGENGQLFNMGVQEYSKKNYAAARDHLLSYLKANGESYQAHYLLANCYLQLADSANAKHSYAMALANKPDPTTKERCLKAIERIAAMQPAAHPATPSSAHANGTGSAAGTTGKTGTTGGSRSINETRINQLQDQIDTIQKDSDRRILQLREEAKAAVEAYTESNGRWLRFSDGERKFTIKKEWEMDVRAPFDNQIEQIGRNTETRIASIRKEIDDLSKGK
jgi:TolA-binding protein